MSRGRPIDSDVEEGECETTIAGMGLWTVCELEYPDDSGGLVDMMGDPAKANDALRTLLGLVSSANTPIDFVPRHFFRLDPRRIAMRGLTSESIARNHARAVDLLSRGTEGNSGEGVGLAMGPDDVEFVLQNFPQLVMYDADELRGLVRFLTDPVPEEMMGVAMVADGRSGRGGAGAQVDCEYTITIDRFVMRVESACVDLFGGTVIWFSNEAAACMCRCLVP